MALDVKRDASEKSPKCDCRELNKSNQAQREMPAGVRSDNQPLLHTCYTADVILKLPRVPPPDQKRQS